jgi:hypothetical protein
MQETYPTETQILDIQKRYKVRGYYLPLPFNVVEIKYDTTSKKVTTFYAVEVRKEI